MRSTYHIPGKNVTIDDTLSWASTHNAAATDKQFGQDTEMFVKAITTALPATEKCLTEISKKQVKMRSTYAQVKQFCQKGWPMQQMPDSLKAYHSVLSELSAHNDILMRGSCNVVPLTLRQDML